jgi:hypothetical protein
MVLVSSLLPLLFPDTLTLTPGSSTSLWMVFWSSLPTFFLNLIPLSVAFAILRYRLWDIDLIIRRTLQYGLLTILIGLVYFGMVVLLGQVFQAVTGQASPLAVVLSTLAIVILFTPLRRRIQTVIDRRFFRSQYNVEHALARFSQNLRERVDLTVIESELVGVVNETIQPEQVMLWIREIEKK